MPAFLVRHGLAVSELVEPAQPLSERGRAEVTRLARHLAAIGVKTDRIYHSTKLRAQETAEILSAELTPGGGRSEVDWLHPAANPQAAGDLLESAMESILLVGHLPHVSRLASLLIVGDPNREIVRFRNATIACLDKVEGRWVLCWLLGPDVLPPTG